MSSAGKRLLQEESLRKGCVSAAGDYACRAADIKHLSAGSLPGTPVGRAVVLQKVGLDTFWSQRWNGKGWPPSQDKAIKTLECACLAILDELIFIISFKNDEVT